MCPVDDARDLGRQARVKTILRRFELEGDVAEELAGFSVVVGGGRGLSVVLREGAGQLQGAAAATAAAAARAEGQEGQERRQEERRREALKTLTALGLGSLYKTDRCVRCHVYCHYPLAL